MPRGIEEMDWDEIMHMEMKGKPGIREFGNLHEWYACWVDRCILMCGV